ncbi:NAD(P)H-dependent flavin oxidoreductase [Actinomycetota bacterium]
MIDTRLVLAPMAGGPSTVALAAAVAEAGGFPFLAGGYLTPERLASDIAELRSATDRPFGVNLFVESPEDESDTEAARAYAARLAPWAELADIELGEPRWAGDHYADKLALAVEARPAVISFVFGWPSAEDVAAVKAAGVEAWMTLSDPADVPQAEELGFDVIVAQGWEAGGHRGGPGDSGETQLSTVDLVREVRSRTGLPIVAAGGIMDADDAQAALTAGADAVACGSAFMRTTEAGTAEVHKEALGSRAGTVVTRCFTGRSARALTTTWTERFCEDAPAAYPQVHFVTAPLRAHGKATGNPELVHLWAGTGHAKARTGPAAEVARGILEHLG